MKRVIVILMVSLFAGLVFAKGASIVGYGGITFQMTIEEVRAVIKKEGNYNLKQVPLKNYYRYYEKGVSEISIWFHNEKVIQIRNVFGGDRLNKS